jgi:two-component system chemotaxis response regulator CheB
MGRRTVLVVDDSPLMRALIADIVESSEHFDVIGEATTGYQAIRLVHELEPDIVTLDLEMPDLHGLDALAYIMTEKPRPVIIVSGQLKSMPEATATAIDYGAFEFVLKPHGDESREFELLRRRLLAALEAAATATISNMRLGRAVRAWKRAQRAAQRAARQQGADAGPGAACAVAIAASTGGPRALVELVPHIRADLAAAILVVQHMPSTFTKLLAERLDSASTVAVREATDGEELVPGAVYIAPGGFHMGLQRGADGVRITLEQGDPVWGVRPAADVLFGAVARSFGPRSLGIVLTGMGRDGAAGLRAIRDVGGWTAVQQIDSAVIASMPRAAAPFAAEQLTLDRIPRAIYEQVAARIRPVEV